jgi:hypothetical protein
MVERSDNRGNDPNTGPDVGSLNSEMFDWADMSTSENLKTIADLFETLISEKRFLQASVLLVQSLKLANKPDMQDIGAVSDLRNYLLTQESVSQISNIYSNSLTHLFSYCGRFSSKNCTGIFMSDPSGASPVGLCTHQDSTQVRYDQAFEVTTFEC